MDDGLQSHPFCHGGAVQLQGFCRSILEDPIFVFHFFSILRPKGFADVMRLSQCSYILCRHVWVLEGLLRGASLWRWNSSAHFSPGISRNSGFVLSQKTLDRIFWGYFILDPWKPDISRNRSDRAIGTGISDGGDLLSTLCPWWTLVQVARLQGMGFCGKKRVKSVKTLGIPRFEDGQW